MDERKENSIITYCIITIIVITAIIFITLISMMDFTKNEDLAVTIK